MATQSQVKTLCRLFFLLLKRNKTSVIGILVPFCICVVYAIMVAIITPMVIIDTSQYSDAMPSAVAELGKYALQYKAAECPAMPDFMDANNDYYLISNARGSDDIADMENYIDNATEAMVGIVADSYNDSAFVGTIVESSQDNYLMGALAALQNQSIQMSVSAAPQSVVENQIYGVFTALLSISFAILYGFPQAYYESFTRNRLDGRKDILIFTGMNKTLYHLVWAGCATLFMAAQSFITLLLVLIVNSDIVGGVTILFQMITIILGAFCACCITDILQNACKTIDQFQQVLSLIGNLIFIVPLLIFGSFVKSIPHWVYSLLAFIPTMPLLNACEAGMAVGLAKSSQHDVWLGRNYGLLQIVLQLFWCVTLLMIAVKCDKALIQSKSPIGTRKQDYTNTKQHEGSAVFGFGVERMEDQVDAAYYALKERRNSSVQSPLILPDNQEAVLSAVVPKTMWPLLIYNVSKTYKTKDKEIRANQHVNLYAQKGEILGVLGPNGSGKTTLCKAIAMAISIDSGDILIDGRSIRQSGGALKNKIGICLQNDAGLFNELTVDEHIWLYGSLCQKRADIDAITQFELTPHRNKRGSELSGGWKRRLTVACALQNDPDVLLLDEITSGVDAVAREQLWALLKKVCVNKTIVATTHTLHEAQVYFDRVAFIMKGQIVCVGSTKEILAQCADKISVEINGMLPDAFFDEAMNKKVIIQNTQHPGQRIQQLEAICPGNIEVLFGLLAEQQTQQQIKSFSINQRQFEQIFFELLRLSE